jgi:hypothetical protein
MLHTKFYGYKNVDQKDVSNIPGQKNKCESFARCFTYFAELFVIGSFCCSSQLEAHTY